MAHSVSQEDIIISQFSKTQKLYDMLFIYKHGYIRSMKSCLFFPSIKVFVLKRKTITHLISVPTEI